MLSKVNKDHTINLFAILLYLVQDAGCAVDTADFVAAEVRTVAVSGRLSELYAMSEYYRLQDLRSHFSHL